MPPPPNERSRRSEESAGSRSTRRQACRQPNNIRYERPRTPETFGLTPVELYVEAVTLFANGWPVDEIRQVLALPDEVLR